MNPEFDQLALDIAKRQYFFPEETSIPDMFRRVVDAVLPHDDNLARQVYEDMVNKRFCPGGRILAGAGTEHGNLLNCFVQDGSPYEPGSTEYALNTAKKLALVTKVGGGNGVNLDPYPRQRFFIPDGVGKAYITIRNDHPNYQDVLDGRFLDLVTGEYITKGYRVLKPIEDSPIPIDEIKTFREIIVPNDSIEDIWDSASEMVRTMLEGNDVLVDLSYLRPEGEPVKGRGGTSSGPASFAVEIFDNFARWAMLGGASHAGPVPTLRYLFAPTLRCIRQGGVRRGAGMATLSASHDDIFGFIEAKNLERERKDGDISTFNISVLMSGTPDTWDKFLLRTIADQAWATGEPGVIFEDVVNEHNLLAVVDGPIKATNPCGEVPLYPGEPCDLGAINVAAFVEDGEFDELKFRYTVHTSLAFLDAVLDAEVAPLPEIERAIKDKRRIGLGIMGLADAFIKLGISYGDGHSQNFTNTVANIMASEALLYTNRADPALSESHPLQRRNVALLTVAPTGTTSMLFGVTSGVEPLFAPFLYRRIGTGYVTVLHPLFKEEMMKYKPGPTFCTWGERVAYYDDGSAFTAYVPESWDWNKLSEAIANNHGSVQGIVGIPEEVQLLFVCAHDIPPMDHIAIQAAMQTGYDWLDDMRTFVGNSISKTINFGNNVSRREVEEAIVYARNVGCKGITVYRDGSRNLQVLNTSRSEDDGSTVASQVQEEIDDIVAASCSMDGVCDT